MARIRRPVKVVKDRPGRLCNRLWSLAPLIADSLESGEQLIIPFFSEYVDLFECLDRFPNVVFVRHSETLAELARRCHRHDIERQLADFLGVEGATFVNSWVRVRDRHAKMSRFADIHALFTPARNHTDKVDECFSAKRRVFDVIVGVHIRRTDYARFRNGRFLYSDREYRAYMLQIRQIFRDQRVGFLVCSDESVNVARYEPLEVFRVPEGNAIEDLFALSVCDCIIGPPSTFSMWASFYGQTPLRFLTSATGSIAPNEFSPIVYKNSFADGSPPASMR